jgi:demethylmenaquinone methyltransferase/2-methoxy-6-polyprenyl-1,4-benzoquinol methylase
MDAYGYLAETVERFPEPEKLAAMVKSAGFRHVGIYPLSCGVAAIHRGVK